MNVSPVAASGLLQTTADFQKAVDQLSSTPNPVDSVNLSLEAAAVSDKHIAYSLAVKSMKIADEIEHLAIDITG
jgi:hypothetical protein